MTISIPIEAELYEYTEDSSNGTPVVYEYSNAKTYEKNQLVSAGAKLFRAKQYIENKLLTNLHLSIENDDADLIHYIEYRPGIRINRFWSSKMYTDPYEAPEEVIKYKYDYGFVLFDYPMVSDMDEVYHTDDTGNFPVPPGNHDYVEFVLNAADVDVKTYTDGSSPASPGTLDTTTNMSFTDFATNYPGYIFITNNTPFKYVSTIGGVWEDNTAYVREDIVDIQFTTDNIANDTRLDSVGVFPQAAVLDNKNYTYHAAKVKSTYTLQAKEAFDTVALTGLIADTVTLTFKQADGTQIGTPVVYTVDNRRESRGVMSDYVTTIVLYCPHDTELTTMVPVGGFVVVEVEAASLQVGGILLGVAADLGITDFIFSTKFIDFSPVEENFSVIEYKEGLKVREFNGSFQFWTTNFDLHDRLLLSLGGKRIIINGSDTTDNAATDSANRFTATMMIGRIQSLNLDTTSTQDRLSDLAKARFTIREQV